ncbi:MAG: hypothetical protein K0S81_3086 [Rhodospirillales bacterium]|nr:hypothetical protein [Rhodospirillales bacterium]
MSPLLFASSSQASATEPDDPISGYSGGNHEHPADWAGAWIAQNFGRCCGKEDCVRIPIGDVSRNADGSYTVLETGEIFDWSDPQIESSEDGTFWRCHYSTGQRQGQTRCLFDPPLGF